MFVYRNTISNLMKANDIQHPRVEFNTTESHLEDLIWDYVRSHPNSGYEEVRAYLRTRQPPVIVKRSRIRTMVASIDPEGVASRWSAVAQRRTYSVKSPNSLWHIDGHHSLVRYVFYTSYHWTRQSRFICQIIYQASIIKSIKNISLKTVTRHKYDIHIWKLMDIESTAVSYLIKECHILFGFSLINE